MTYQLYKDNSKQWRWRLMASNSKIIADSAEAYINRSDCLHGIELVKSSAQAPILHPPENTEN